METLLGIDVGTTATKALLLNMQGKIVAEGSYNYEINKIGEYGYEQDPEELWQGVVNSCQQVLAKAPSDDNKVQALSLSTQAGTTIPVAEKGEPVRPAISWMDHRGREYMHHLDQITPEEGYRRCGWKINPAFSIMHIIRLAHEEPKIFNNAFKFLFVNDFIIHRLTGDYFMDPSNAGITGLINVRDKKWDTKLLGLAGINGERLSQVLPSGEVLGQLTKRAARELGLSPETVVVNGAHDQYCAAVGAGVLTPGDLLISAGTAWVILMAFSDVEAAFATKMQVSSYPLPGLWGALDSAGAVGKAMSWLVEEIISSFEIEDPYQWLEQAVTASSPGANGLIFVPPAVATAKDSVSGFVNLNIKHTVNDLARAVMEGIVYEIKTMAEKIDASQANSSRLIMVGRPAENSIWPQIVADVFNLPLEISGVSQAAALGAAILAGIGIEAFSDAEIVSSLLITENRKYYPDQNNHRIYQKQMERYQSIVDSCKIKT